MVSGTDETINTQQQQQERNFQHFLIKVASIYAVLSIGLFLLFSTLLDQRAYQDMSGEEVQHISEMVFESMYTAMLAGGGSKGIEAAARRMNATGPGMTISVVRGETIAQKFGDNKVDAMRRQNDLAIFDVFSKGEEQYLPKDNRIRYLYPAMFREQCQQCHDNSTPGEVAAVVEIIYPVDNLKVSTSYVNNLMIAYFGLSFVVLLGFLGWHYKVN